MKEYVLRKCAVCGKVFEPPLPDDWVYKAYSRTGMAKLWFCSWHCLRKAEAEDMRRTYKPITGPKVTLSKGGLLYAIAQSGLSSARLSLKLDRSKSYLRSMMKHEPIRTSKEMAERIADVCGVSLSVILKEDST